MPREVGEAGQGDYESVRVHSVEKVVVFCGRRWVQPLVLRGRPVVGDELESNVAALVRARYDVRDGVNGRLASLRAILGYRAQNDRGSNPVGVKLIN